MTVSAIKRKPDIRIRTLTVAGAHSDPPHDGTSAASGSVVFQGADADCAGQTLRWTVVKHANEDEPIAQILYEDDSERVSAEDPMDNDPYVAAVLAHAAVVAALKGAKQDDGA